MVFSFAALGISLLATLLFIGINTLILWFLTNYLLNWQDKSVETAFKTAVIVGLITFVLNIIASFTTGSFATILGVIIFIINIIILLYFIKRFYYHTNWVEPLKAWICLFIVDIILGFLVGIVLTSLGLVFGGI